MFGLAAALAAARVSGAQQLAPEHCVLESVPYMGPEWEQRIGHSADFALPAQMRSVMLYLDGESDRDYYVYFAAGGIGFRQLWDPAGWRILCDNHWLMDEDPLDPIRRSFETAGYGFEIVGNRALCEANEYPLEGFGAYVDAEGTPNGSVPAWAAGGPSLPMAQTPPRSSRAMSKAGRWRSAGSTTSRRTRSSTAVRAGTCGGTTGWRRRR